ncbi:MAG: M56 family metallopeptidase [Terriglobales bacterium]
MNVLYSLLIAAAQGTAERILHSFVLGIALTAFAWALLRVIPRPNASTRFAVWFTALLATAFLPLLGGPLYAFRSMGTAVPPLVSVPPSWALYLALAWAGAAAIGLLRVGAGLIELRRLRQSCRAIENADPAWQATAARICPSRHIEILTSDRVDVPTALGFFKPMVVIPAGLLDQLSPAEMNQVLLHELAHLRRWDDWTNALQKLVKALLFFHPAAWWMEQRIALEREVACDDAVLAETSSPHAYARCLAGLAEKSFERRSTALVQAAVNRVRQTTLRVARILDVNRPRTASGGKFSVALVAAFTCACVGIVSQLPPLVSFQDQSTSLAIARPALLVSPQLALNRSAVDLPPSAFKRPASAPRLIQAKSNNMSAAELGRQGSQALRPRPVLARTVSPGAPRFIQAKVNAMPQTPVTTGVLIIFVDDPVFGPTPIVFHFAVWHAAPAQSPAEPQKNI